MKANIISAKLLAMKYTLCGKNTMNQISCHLNFQLGVLMQQILVDITPSKQILVLYSAPMLLQNFLLFMVMRVWPTQVNRNCL